jgi:hypothetical protein
MLNRLFNAINKATHKPTQAQHTRSRSASWQQGAQPHIDVAKSVNVVSHTLKQIEKFHGDMMRTKSNRYVGEEKNVHSVLTGYQTLLDRFYLDLAQALSSDEVIDSSFSRFSNQLSKTLDIHNASQLKEWSNEIKAKHAEAALGLSNCLRPGSFQL